MGLDTNCSNIKDALSILTVCPDQTWALVCVNITKITLQMGLDTSCNNIKDVLSLSTVSPHQRWVNCMCKYHKNNFTNGTEYKL